MRRGRLRPLARPDSVQPVRVYDGGDELLSHQHGQGDGGISVPVWYFLPFSGIGRSSHYDAC
jgi:hypothetical protein